MIVRQGLSVVLSGLAIGILSALWLSELVSALFYGVAASDWTNIVVPVGVLIVTTLLACYVPARRAASVDLVEALRSP